MRREKGSRPSTSTPQVALELRRRACDAAGHDRASPLPLDACRRPALRDAGADLGGGTIRLRSRLVCIGAPSCPAPGAPQDCPALEPVPEAARGFFVGRDLLQSPIAAFGD